MDLNSAEGLETPVNHTVCKIKLFPMVWSKKVNKNCKTLQYQIKIFIELRLKKMSIHTNSVSSILAVMIWEISILKMPLLISLSGQILLLNGKVNFSHCFELTTTQKEYE